MYIVGGTDSAVSDYGGVDDIVVDRVRDHNGGLASADGFIAGREEMGWYTGEEEFLGIRVVDRAIRGCRVGVEAQGTDEVARVDAAIALAGISCEGEECDDEEVGEVHCGWGCGGILRVKRAFILSGSLYFRSEDYVLE